MRIELAALIIALLTSPPLGAQWRVEIGAGGSNHPQIASTDSRSALFGVQYHGRRWGYLTAGAPLDSAAAPWIAVGAGQRVERYVGSFDVGSEIGAHAHGYRTPDAEGRGFLLELVPFIGTSLGMTRLELGSGARYYANRFADENEARAASDTYLLASAPLTRGVSAGARGRYVHTEDGGFPFASVGVDVAVGEALLSAHAGHWLGNLLSKPVYGASATLLVGRRTAVFASFDQEAPDPLFWNPVRTSWGVGVSYQLGKASSRPAVSAPVQPGGPVTFRVPLAEDADQVSVAGDFNGWDPVPMQRVGDEWAFTLSLQPGVYHYSFRRGDGTWFLPSTVSSRTDDGFGGESGVLIVGSSE